MQQGLERGLMRGKEGGKAVGEVGKEAEKEDTKAGVASKPPTPPPFSDHGRVQGMGDKTHERRWRQHRRHYHCYTLMNVSVDACKVVVVILP